MPKVNGMEFPYTAAGKKMAKKAAAKSGKKMVAKKALVKKMGKKK
jgi:hypothetical protein